MMTQFNVKKLLIALTLIFITGCASTVTVKETAGSQVLLTITFEGTPNFINYNYYIVYSDTDFSINTNLTQNYFFIPGEPYGEISLSNLNSSLNNAYDSYFDTWTGAIKLNNSNAELTLGSFSNSTSTDEEHFSYTSEDLSIPDYSVSNSTISLTLSVSELSLDSTNFLFTLIVTNGTSESDIKTINVQDMIDPIQEVVLIANQSTLTYEQSSSFSGSGGAKIKSWSITVY